MCLAEEAAAFPHGFQRHSFIAEATTTSELLPSCATSFAHQHISHTRTPSNLHTAQRPTFIMAEQAKYYEMYRNASIGSTLADTLDDLISSRRIEPQLAIKIMTNFDQVIAQVLGEKVKARMSFKGHLDTYRFCDDVWTFILKDIKFKLDNSQTIEVEKVRIVSLLNANSPHNNGKK
ncbi:hypothetical protein E4T42_06495 [Aureobasidium subglaciale]|uniref:Transcription initiation factor IIA subunit 2 n=1 Tax=Aureobasidium subglaciale (strain EXF-2481) TaxID=1043005 RepID=A0A074YTY7_AURSE|nr:uncharacterized protein AUEXF2481DRAFT_38102 [Aureobasidium subglaciale EXF-2481]KAI5199051.1 hypothetical protein E4T38_07208 [Aureobasidium subglaciale]KAI5217800.1 hypothetical protein E4T40_07219 [Aureobasidium subglaciale]KAI5220690.1 hypothetical protein E4T41_07373 [Aureobasidium subglaciale]KAI5246268.1 hypothetical protein E4T42_06495 [Aureobasidium subglaciale]KAI5258392.1 hypothetical protein E4T46_07350 [Aureobasidium subglaciale]